MSDCTDVGMSSDVEALSEIVNLDESPSMAISDYKFGQENCAYRDGDTGIWHLASDVGFNSIKSFWLKKAKEDKRKKEYIHTDTLTRKRKRPVIQRRDDIEIVGLVKAGNDCFDVAIKYLDSGKVCVLPSVDARKRYPFELSLFYESHIHFPENE